ncbi:GxxExxY protein [Polaribacter sp.]|nr:GxxExxY protein [Polaribacter sp.]
MDLLIQDCLVVELKSVKEIQPIFEAQILTYMHLLKAPKGIIVNFNCLNLFKQGQKIFVNDILENYQNKL